MSAAFETVLVISSTEPLPDFSNRTPALPNIIRKSQIFLLVLGAVTFSAGPSASSSTPIDQATVYSESSVAVESVLRKIDALMTPSTAPDSVDMMESSLIVAKSIILNLPASVSLPHISSSDDGEVGFSWINFVDRLEAVLTPDNHMVWVTKINGHYEVGDAVDALDKSGLNKFYETLEAFYGMS